MNEHHAQAATLVAINKDLRAEIGKLEYSSATAEAKANRYRAQRDTLRRILSRSSPEEYESARIARAEECEAVEELGR